MLMERGGESKSLEFVLRTLNLAGLHKRGDLNIKVESRMMGARRNVRGT